MRIVMTSGVFDLLHVGHLNLLRNARNLGDVLVVGVLTDEGAKAYKREPVQDEVTRLEVIRALDCVDFAFLQRDTDPTRELEVIRPDVLAHGSDWARLLRGQETVERLGIQWALLPYTEGVSTSELVAQVVNRYRDSA